MKNLLFAKRIKTGMQVFLLLTMLIFNFGPGNSSVVYALPPSNDEFTSARVIDQISYSDGPFDITEATQVITDPDNVGPCSTSGTTVTKQLNRGNNTVWYTYTPSVKELIALNTIGSEYSPGDDMDTYLAVWTGTEGNLTLIKCNDDNFVGQTSELTFKALPGVIYYIEVANYNCEEGISSCGQTLGGTLVFNARISNTHVTIAKQLRGSYYIPTGASVRATYASMNKGPALVEGSLNQPVVAALGVKYKQGGKYVSYSQTMGFPAEQATTEYYFPWYATTSSQSSQLRVANVSDQDTTVDVYVKGVLKGSYPLTQGTAQLIPPYSGVNAGPVYVVSTNPAANIVASMRVVYKRSGKNVSYSELMGYPKEKLTTSYLFPRNINNTALKSQLRVANAGLVATDVKVYINNVLKKTISALAPDTAVQVPIPGTGVMRVESANPAVNIITSLRQIYYQNGVLVSYSELMGYPEDQLTTSYAFPWYTNNTTMATKLYIVNVSNVNTTVEIYIGGDLKGTPISLAAGKVIAKSYAGNIGPVRVDSTVLGANILVSMQIIYKPYGVPVSYGESTGYPYLAAQPTTEYWFPWYTKSSSIITQMLIGYP